MAAISLKNFKKHFSDDTKLWAAKCTVRECDEESKGHFVAFVDLGDQSFDVSVTINTKQEIISSTCECTKGDALCQHKFALLLHISGNEKVATPKITKNKITPLERILSELSHEDLKIWVSNILTTDKALQAGFIQEFTVEEDNLLTQPEVEKKLKELLKAVIGSKKKVETADFKKAMSLWESFALNHIKIYLKKPTLNVHFEQLQILQSAMYEQVSVLYTKTATSYYNISKKINAEIAKTFNESLSEEDFKAATEVLAFHLVESQSFNSSILQILLKVFGKATDKHQKQITGLVIEQYKKFHVNTKFGDKYFTQVAWLMIERTDSYEIFEDYILPISYENDFNTDFIGRLIESKKFDKAIDFCNSIIRSNYYPEYNFPYWAFLKKLYVATKQTEKAVAIKKEMIPFTGNFEDFLEVYEGITDENERRSYRINLLTKFRTNLQRGTFNTTDLFCIKLAGYENNYNKLIDYLGDYKYIQFFMPYLEDMFEYNKKRTLLNIINNFQNLHIDQNSKIYEAEKESYLLAYEILCKFFAEDELTAFLKHHLPFHRKAMEGSLVYFIAKNLI